MNRPDGQPRACPRCSKAALSLEHPSVRVFAQDYREGEAVLLRCPHCGMRILWGQDTTPTSREG